MTDNESNACNALKQLSMGAFSAGPPAEEAGDLQAQRKLLQSPAGKGFACMRSFPTNMGKPSQSFASFNLIPLSFFGLLCHAS